MPCPEQGRAAATRLVGGVVGGINHPRDAGLDERVRARRLAAPVRAGLERHEHGCPGGIVAAALGIGKRCALRVEPAELRVPALADHLLVARDHTAHERVRRNPAAPQLGQLEGSLQVAPILFGEACGHVTPLPGGQCCLRA